MSVWNEIRKKSLGQSVRQEELDERIVSMNNEIINMVAKYNDLVKDIETLDEKCSKFVHTSSIYSLGFYDDKVVNDTLNTHNYEQLRKLLANIYTGIIKLQQLKKNFESKLSKLQHQAKLNIIKENKLREQEQEERDRRIKEANKRLTIKLILGLVFTVIVTALSIFGFVHFGYHWWGGLLIGTATLCLLTYFIGESENL